MEKVDKMHEQMRDLENKGITPAKKQGEKKRIGKIETMCQDTCNQPWEEKWENVGWKIHRVNM